MTAKANKAVPRLEEAPDLTPGDKRLVKQEKKNKLSTPFPPQPYDVVSKLKVETVLSLKRNMKNRLQCRR